MSTDIWMRRAAVLTARELRRNMTAAERLLWERLRNKRLAGMKFHRQHPIAVEMDGREIFVVADFFCHARRLVVEVDGSIHKGREQQDKARAEAIERLGLRVIRFTNSELLQELERVLREIAEVAHTPPFPFEGKGGGGIES